MSAAGDSQLLSAGAAGAGDKPGALYVVCVFC